MNASDSVTDLLATAADRIRREAYAAGWRDALEAVKKALSDVPDPEALEDLEIREATSAPMIFLPSDKTGPKPGTTPWQIVQAVKKKPGMSAGEIIDALQAIGHSAPETSIRTSISRMKDRKFIVLRHGKWYPN